VRGTKGPEVWRIWAPCARHTEDIHEYCLRSVTHDSASHLHPYAPLLSSPHTGVGTSWLPTPVFQGNTPVVVTVGPEADLKEAVRFLSFEGTSLQASGESPLLQGGEDTDRVDGRMMEMSQMWMHGESSSCGGVLPYVGAPEGSQGAADDHFLHAAGRPLNDTIGNDEKHAHDN